MENGLYRIQGVETTTESSFKNFLKTNQNTILITAAVIVALIIINKS